MNAPARSLPAHAPQTVFADADGEHVVAVGRIAHGQDLHPGGAAHGSHLVVTPGDPAVAAGVSVHGEWDPLGMRGTVSRTILFENVAVGAWFIPAYCSAVVSTADAETATTVSAICRPSAMAVGCRPAMHTGHRVVCAIASRTSAHGISSDGRV